ncbi:potassium channel family protein [Anaerosporobacter sp.]|uniref:potassium channel family protein n=1 Tax=Anaerosporobacter sp. TaxID=1872529 RepID=UPI00286F96AF|nr:ion transporter [Anaerosporobacter sp.]
MNTNRRKTIYDIVIGILAIIAVIISIIDIRQGLSPTQSIIDNIVFYVFVIDYIVRFIIAKNKKKFIKSNVLDLISILPFNSAFKAFRLMKVMKVSKLSKLSKLSRFVAVFARLLKRCKNFFNTNGFKYIILITTFFIIVCAVGMSYFEGTSFSDSIWWSFVTTTTVGYGDLSPTTSEGRIIAVILMVVGIGLIGSLTSTITSYFMKTKRVSIKDEILSSVIERLNDFESLTSNDVDELCEILKKLKS